MHKKITLSLIAFLAIGVGSCINDQPVEIPEDCSDIEWHYEGHGGPSEWQNLCLGYAECGGATQSPINITQTSVSSGANTLNFNYTTTSTDVVNNGHTIQFNYNSGSTMQWRGESWQLLQFHMHTAS